MKMDINKLLKRKERAKRDGNLHQLAEVVKNLGDLYFESGRLDDALEEYFQQLKTCSALNDTLNCAIAHRMIGEVYASLGDYQQALLHQQQHLDGAKEVKNLLEEQRAMATLGRTHFCLAEALTENREERDKALASAKASFTGSIRLCQELETRDLEPKELITMRARLLLNLGLVLEAQGYQEEAVDLIEKSASLFEGHGLREDLCRTQIALAGVFERHGDYGIAIRHLENAAQVENYLQRAEALLLKIDLLLKTEKWQEARTILVSLYVRCCNNDLPQDIKRKTEKLLRIVITLQSAESKLRQELDFENQLKLYELLGDASAAASSFDKAVQYYKEMLRLAEEHDTSKKGAALVSLARTLKDLGRYSEAVLYARNELQLCTDSREICRSAIFLADLLIDSGAPDTELGEVYKKAIEEARKSGDAALQKQVFKELSYYLKNIEKKADERPIRAFCTEMGIAYGEEDHFISMNESESVHTSDSENESLANEVIGGDICLENLSDVEYELAAARSSRKTRRRCSKGVASKKNEKGETGLHIACITGNISAVEKLLAMNHPVDVKDNFGWTPLHEAANHGYIDIAKMLLDHGANVNDPGGPLCRGVTPLHDAASCGNLSMMRYLLDRGANPELETSDGDTVLDCLVEWKDRADNLSPGELDEYAEIHQKLSDLLKEHYHSKVKQRKVREGSLDICTRNSINKTENKISPGLDYKRTIASLKRRNNHIGRASIQLRESHFINPLIDEEDELVTDWLENDLDRSVEKKNTENSIPCVRSKRKPDTSDIVASEKNKRQKLNIPSSPKENARNENEEDSDDSTLEISSGDPTRNAINIGASHRNQVLHDSARLNETEKSTKVRKKKQQISLLSTGFNISKVPSSNMMVTIPASAVCHSSFEPISFDVIVDGKGLKVKVNVVSQNSNVFDEILTKVQETFYGETGCKTTLSLLTIDGISYNSEELGIDQRNLNNLVYEVVKAEVPPLTKRYETICHTYSIGVRDIVLKSLKSCENTCAARFGLEDITNTELQCVLRALEYQKQLQILRVAGGELHHAGLLLNNCFARISVLRELYLQSCGLDIQCLQRISRLPPGLKLLDLSYNPLQSDKRKVLQQLLEPLHHLETLNLKYCHLADFEVPLGLLNLVTVDLSWNPLLAKSLRNVLQKQLLNLNLSGTLYENSNGETTSLLYEYTLNIHLMKLECLEMACCNVTDSHIRTLLSQMENLTRIILAGNKLITEKTANFLFKRCPNFKYIDLTSCAIIGSPPCSTLMLKNFEMCTFLASMEPHIVDSWLALWKGKCVAHSLPENVIMFKPLNAFPPVM